MFVVVENVYANGSSAINVALNADVALHGGSFFTGGWGGGLVVSEDTIVDGVFFPRHHQWDQGPVWWDCHDEVDRYITIDLGEVYIIESFIVQADDNDAYLLYYRDITTSSWELAWHVPNYDAVPDPSNWGMQTRPNPDDDTERYLLPQKIITDTLMLRGDMDDGDQDFSISEIQAFGALKISVDVKPGSWPNPVNTKSRGVLTVAVCGSEDFDVSTIDPTSVTLTFPGAIGKVYPLRWSLEDVATPYTLDAEGGHDLEGDGHLDLVLKYKTQELVGITLTHDIGNTIPIILTGNLMEEYGNTPIHGEDWVKVK